MRKLGIQKFAKFRAENAAEDVQPEYVLVNWRAARALAEGRGRARSGSVQNALTYAYDLYICGPVTGAPENCDTHKCPRRPVTLSFSVYHFRCTSDFTFTTTFAARGTLQTPRRAVQPDRKRTCAFVKCNCKSTAQYKHHAIALACTSLVAMASSVMRRCCRVSFAAPRRQAHH